MPKTNAQGARRKAAGTGICKLTGKTGRFVRSHLMPRALTAPDRKGVFFLHIGGGRRPERRWTSWYDDELVIEEGEEILAKLDDWAIAALRKHQLVWTGWGAPTSLPVEQSPRSKEGLAFRIVSGIDGHKLRLFFLSLLWRAAATTRPEFAAITLPDADLSTLQQLLVNGTPGPLEFYPTTLIQMSTRGRAHNSSPIPFERVVPNLPGLGHQAYQTYRFYLDGLEASVLRQASGNIDWLGPAVVGNGNSLVVATVPFERSWQFENIETAALLTRTLYPRRPG
jgi:hypothetical protein